MSLACYITKELLFIVSQNNDQRIKETRILVLILIVGVVFMPVRPQIRIIDKGGWKHDENTRFGSVVVCIFETYDQEGNVKTFHFAPTLKDLPIIDKLIFYTKKVDEYNKAVHNMKMEAESLKPEDQEGCL